MTKKFTKTVKLRLRKPTERKYEIIKQAMKESKEVANETSKRLPGIPKKFVKNPTKKGSPLYDIVKDMKNNGITINSACAFEAVNKAREAFASKMGNRNYKGIPVFDKPFVRLHNRDNIHKFFEKDGNYFVTIKLRSKEEVTLPFYPGDFQNHVLDKIVNEGLDYGSADIKEYRDFMSFNLAIKKDVDLEYQPKTFVGIDLGLNMLAWGVALDKDGNFLGEKHFRGGEAGWVRDRHNKKRKRLQREGNIKMVKKIGSRENRWMENKNHVISKRIIEFAEQFSNPLIILEDIKGKEIRERVDNPKIHSWRFGELREFIEYKAFEKGIKTHRINPRNTSKMCSRCGHVDNGNRSNIDFRCKNCGYQAHADFNASKNIALVPATG